MQIAPLQIFIPRQINVFLVGVVLVHIATLREITQILEG